MSRLTRVVVVLAVVGGCSASPSQQTTVPSTGSAAPASTASTARAAADRLTISVEGRIDHDRTSFTQGLVMLDGQMYESAGMYGESSLRTVNPDTGAVLAKVALDPQYFAEGLAAVGDRLIQLTWREGTALVYDRATLRQTASFSYEGEGWGLCFDGTSLVMSDGSSTLTFRDPTTFAILRRIDVTLDGAPVTKINELECVGGRLWANVWQTDQLLRIDPGGGVVDGVVEVTGLLSESEQSQLGPDDVLNGIADAGDGRLYITGKRWPAMFLVHVND